MPVAVHRHLVTGVDDLAGKRRPPRDLFPDEEEGRRRTARASASSTAGVPWHAARRRRSSDPVLRSSLRSIR